MTDLQLSPFYNGLVVQHIRSEYRNCSRFWLYSGAARITSLKVVGFFVIFKKRVARSLRLRKE